MKDAIKNVLGKIINYKYFEIIAIFIYKIILDLIFLTYMKDYNIYYISDFSIYKWGISIILMLILYKIIHSVKEDIIRFFIKIFYLLMFIPISTVYMGRNFSTFWYVILFLEIALIVFTIKLIRYLIKSKIFKKCIKKVKFNINYEFTTKLIYYIFIINTLVVLFLCVYYNGWPTLEALNFRHVYQVREQFYLPKFGNYLYTFEITFILQFLLILYLHKKKYIKLSMVIFVSIFLYLIKGEKVVLLSIILVICSYKIFQYGKKYMERIIPVVMSIILPLTLMFGHSNMMTAVIITRLLIIPANLKFLYFDFFSNNPKIGIVGTVLNAFLKLPNPYDQMPYQNLIAGIYLNDYNMNEIYKKVLDKPGNKFLMRK